MSHCLYGTDTKGKQEVEAALIAKGTVFTDEVAQSISIGEAQHAIADGLITPNDITELGAVINGTHAGRSSDTEITIFDGTGVGLQDLAVAAKLSIWRKNAVSRLRLIFSARQRPWYSQQNGHSWVQITGPAGE